MSAALMLTTLAATFAAVGGGGGGGNTGFRGGAVMTYAGGNFTGTVPAGVVAGDVMYVAFLQDAGTTTVGSTGFSAESSGVTPTNSFPCTLLKKVAAGTESGTTLTFPTGASVGEGVLFIVSGANASPVDATTTVATGTAATITYPSITTAHTFSAHYVVVCNFNGLATTPATYSPRQASATWVTAASKVIATASTVSGITSTNGGEWVAFSIAVRSS